MKKKFHSEEQIQEIVTDIIPAKAAIFAVLINQRLREASAADVVEVVRCRDCKHYNAGFECLIEGYGIERPADYFCADGKRKDGGQDDGTA